jgi:hypothetical protein
MEDKTPLTAEETIAKYIPSGEGYNYFGGATKLYGTTTVTCAMEEYAARAVAQQTASLQERIAQLERENESGKLMEGELIKRINSLIKERADAVRLNEKLMGLMEDVFIENCERKYQEIFWWKNPERWQSFCKEKGISQPPNGS